MGGRGYGKMRLEENLVRWIRDLGLEAKTSSIVASDFWRLRAW